MASTIEQIKTAVGLQKVAEDRVRTAQPLVRLWDAEWALQHVVGDDYSSQFTWQSNDTGPGQTELPFTSPAAQWIFDYQARLDAGSGRTVGITVDHVGARWSGIMDKFSVEQRDDGDLVLVVDWLHDYEHLKWYSVTPNPFMPDEFQFPRAWVVAGPITWVLRLSLFMALYREQNPFLTWPDDPMDFDNWATMGLDQADWHIVVKPESFIDALASGVVWGVATSRWTNFHDMAWPMCEDAEISITCTRYLEGDPDPWDGFTAGDIRYGTIVVSFEDKSGIMVGTSNGGTVFDGLTRTVIEFADDFIDSSLDVIADADTPGDYFAVGSRYTSPLKPYVIFYEGDSSPIQTSSWVYSPSKGVQIECGGKSMPGVNEAISATIQGIGDIFGNLVKIGSLGGTIDTILAPLYSDTILAWQTFKSSNRATNTGWDRLHAYFQDSGGGKAFTIQAVLVLRAGMWATKTMVSWKVEVSDGAPYMVGDNGVGHFFLDDRVGLVIKGDDKIHMDRCRKIDLAWGPENPPEFQITIGDDRIWQDTAQRALGRIERVLAGMHDLGVS